MSSTSVFFRGGGSRVVGYNPTEREIEHPPVVPFEEIPEKFVVHETPTAGRLTFGDSNGTDVERDTIRIGATVDEPNIDHVIGVLNHEYMHLVLIELIGAEATKTLDNIEDWDAFLHDHTDLLGTDRQS